MEKVVDARGKDRGCSGDLDSLWNWEGWGERRLLKVGGDVLPAPNSVFTVTGPGTTTNEYCICALTAHLINQRN